MQKPIPAMLAASAQMSASRANKRTWLRVWPDMLREGIFKCPPAEQINAHGFGSGLRERLVFIGTCSVTTTLVSAFTKSDNRAKVKFSFDLLEPHIGSLLLAFLCLT